MSKRVRSSSRRRDSFPPPSSSTSQNPPARQALRTTKITEKLVLFPDNLVDKIITDDGTHSRAERLNKEGRQQIPRVTSYCVCEVIQLNILKNFVQNSHGVQKSKKFDECLYFSYGLDRKEMLFGNSTTPRRSKGDTNYDTMGEDSQGSHPEGFPDWMSRGDVFIFDYGVVVLWNFTDQEESNFLSHMLQFQQGTLKQDDVQTEDFHFQYDMASAFRGRIYNDMITIKSNSIMIKLSISHGLAQSVKLSLFENAMEETIESTEPLPRMLAKDGSVPIPRTEIMKTVGKLYKLKMNVNLISNVLDTPEMFWSEPGLEGLYTAIRGYLEISQRAALLNKRADIINDLLSMLSDHLNSNEMTYITWIIIVLICVAVFIACSEVIVKLMRLAAGFDDL